jgi:ketosteroid isomerase-like protein
MNHTASLEQLIAFFESISLDTVDQLHAVYTEDVVFKDPFNEVRGLAQVTRIFTHMFSQVDQPRFVVTTHVLQGDQAFLTWDFLFRMKRFSNQEQCIRGATHLRFAPDGRACLHRDYWDAAEELYEKLPLLGSLMRGLKRLARG